MKKTPISKFKLYEESVQSPNWQVHYLPQYHTYFHGKAPLSMREDFCGTAKISCEWVKQSPRHQAVGLDLDRETLKYAKKENISLLSSSQKKQIKLLRQNVLKPTRKKFDWIGAYNFSFYTFHERKILLQYFKSVYQSLNKRGTFFLEMAGGEGFKETVTDKKSVRIEGLGKVQSLWEQKQYDPITQVNHYAIHFRLPNGKWIENAFQYHWRIWEIRETREILQEAGFEKTVVLWEHSDEDADEFFPQENAEPRRDWLAYLVGIKKP
jgi:hypothetical protein